MSTSSEPANQHALDLLLTRRSVKADDLMAPGPSAEELERILTAASRVPDHGKLAPFYYLVFEGDARAKAGDILAEAYTVANPDCRDGKADIERQRFMRSPLVVAIIHRARMSKNPQWEQFLTCGAAAQNFVLAAHALGYSAQWLTEWYAYDENVRQRLGLDDTDIIAGFMYVGTAKAPPEERDRPDLAEIVTHWSLDASVKKGDIYHREKFGYPELGFKH